MIPGEGLRHQRHLGTLIAKFLDPEIPGGEIPHRSVIANRY
jgi:hypothetical protein